MAFGCLSRPIKKPLGELTQPFVDPGTGYEDILWEWDAIFHA